MKLDKLVITVIAVIFIVALSVAALLSYSVLINSYSRLEKAEINTDTERVMSAIDNDIANLNKTTHDWSSWDDTYYFALGNNEAYLDSNLNSSSLVNLNINSIIIFNNSGGVAGSKSVDLNREIEVETDSQILTQISENPKLFFNMSANSSVEGFMKGSYGPVILVARPIMKSDETGSVAGIIVFTKNFDPDFIEEIREVTNLYFSYQNTESVNMRGGNEKWSYREGPVNESTISGIQAVYSVDGNQLGIITVRTPRPIMNEGLSSIIFFLIALVTLSLLSIVVFFYILNRFILKRIKKMQDNIDAIGILTNSFEPLVIEGDDELDSLAISYNSMFKRIISDEKTIIVSLEKYRSLLENANDAIMVISNKKYKILDINANAEELLGIKKSEIDNITFCNFFHESQHITVKKMITDSILIGKSDIPHIYARHILGHDIPVEVRASFVKIQNEEFFLVIIRDITRRIHSEEHLKRIINQLTRLIQVTGYDVTNQIMSLRGYLELSTECANDKYALELLVNEKAIVEYLQNLIAFTHDYQEIGINEPEWQDLNKVLDKIAASIEIDSLEIKSSFTHLSIFADKLLEKALLRLIYNLFINGKNLKKIYFASKEEPDGLVLSITTEGNDLEPGEVKDLFIDSSGPTDRTGLHLIMEILAITNISIDFNFLSKVGIIIYIKVPQGKYRYGHESLV